MIVGGTRGRPRGEIAAALVKAAARSPGTVAQLAERACVGYDAARYKASALVRSGALVPLTEGRPRVLKAADGALAAPAQGDEHDNDGCALRELPRGFWAYVAAHAADADSDRDDEREADAMR